MISREHRHAWMTIIFVLVFVFAVGCAPAVDPPEEPDEPVEPEEPEEPEDPPEPERVVVAQPQGVGSWDPPQCWLTAPEWLIENAYDYLLMKSPDGAEWVPQLATEWEWIDEYTKRFYLRDDVEFHDGTPLTAEDVKFHYRRIIEGTREEYILRAQYEWIDEMIIHDDYTIDFVCQTPDALILWKIAQQNNGAGIVSKAYFEEVGIDGVHRSPMGSGPWIKEEWVRDEHVLFSANEDYWGGRPDFDELEFRIIPEASTRVAELLTGGVDLIYDVMPEDQNRIEDNPGTSTQWQDTGSGYFLAQRRGINPEIEPGHELDRYYTTEDLRIRTAVEKAIDKYALRDFVGGTGEAFRARIFEPLPHAHPDLYGPEACLYDPDRARELIEEAGYEEGEAYLKFHAREDYPFGDLARVIEDYLTAVGFDVDMTLLDQTTFNQEVYFPIHSEELMLNSLGGQLNPFFALSQYHMPNERMMRYGEFEEEVIEELNPLLEKAWDSRTPREEKYQLYQEASMIIAEQRIATGLFQHSTLWGMSDRIDYTPRFDGDIMGMDIKKGQ